MDEEFFQLLAVEFERLFTIHNPFDGEPQRQAFRNAWMAFMTEHNTTDDAWEDELCRRMDLNKVTGT